jgi:TPR repeat protein
MSENRGNFFECCAITFHKNNVYEAFYDKDVWSHPYVHHLKKLAEQGNELAICVTLLQDRVQWQEAIHRLKKLLSSQVHQDPNALFILGMCYYEGVGVPKNPIEANRLFLLSKIPNAVVRITNNIKSSDKDIMMHTPKGQLLRGLTYLRRNHDEMANIWFLTAASFSHINQEYKDCSDETPILDALCGDRIEACYQLAISYDTGRGVKRNAKASERWLKIAACGGHEKALALPLMVKHFHTYSKYWLRCIQEGTVVRELRDPFFEGDGVIQSQRIGDYITRRMHALKKK